jgi:hypothetical protein
MAGKWLPEPPKPHVCMRPDIYNSGKEDGAIWQCGCGRQWIVRDRWDQREGHWKQWELGKMVMVMPEIDRP